MTLAILYGFLIVTKAVLALRHASEPESSEPVTIVQPILSGDPLLEGTLRRNLEAHPRDQFLWMIDADDGEAQRIASTLARSHLRVVLGPPLRDGENPKLAKLIGALNLVATERLVVLDDDTFLAGALPGGDLVTGLPLFLSKGTFYERLIGGFVNGSAILTYLPAAKLQLQRTINGMLYSVDTARLRAIGGFAAAGHELTDDYAVARLYLRNGHAITQSTVMAMVGMTVSTGGHYMKVMRRWMIFAARYFGDNSTPATVFWIGLPALLPLVGFVINPLLWLPLLVAKAIVNRMLLKRITGVASGPLDILFECLADLLTPVWMLVAFVRPNQLTWRSRNIQMRDGAIHYK